jgi:hypothetical protein
MRLSSLPQELCSPLILRTWYSAGVPRLSDWASTLQQQPEYEGRAITSIMLFGQLARALNGTGLTLKKFRKWALTPESLVQAGGPGMPYWKDYVGLVPHDQETRFVETSGGAEASSESSQIKTLEQLLEVCQVDQHLWKVARYEINKYNASRKDTVRELTFDEGKISGHISDSGGVRIEEMYSIRVWLERREVAVYEDAADLVIERIQQAAPTYPVRFRQSHGEYLFAPQLYDAHFGKRSVSGQYTIQQAFTDYTTVGDAAIDKALSLGMSIGRIVLPVGNDALHADNLEGRTTKGTWLEMSSDQRDAIDALCAATEYFIGHLAQIAPVDVVPVPGNHDRMSVHWLGRVLAARFHNHPHVQVLLDKKPRHYYAYGTTLICMEHGDKVKPDKLGLTMAVEAPELWSKASYREVWRGHIHRQQQLYQPVNEDQGVLVRTIPALCEADEYHLLHAFVGVKRAAEALFYHEEHGPAGSFPVFVSEIQE